MQKRVAVTGLGCVTPFGIGKNVFFYSIVSGKSEVSLISSFDTTDFKTKIGAEIKDFDASVYFSPNEIRKMDRFTRFAAVAAKDALEDSGINLQSLDKNRFGVVLGTGFGGISTTIEQYRTLSERGASRVSPFCVPMMIPGMAAGFLSILFGAAGPNETVSTACASSSHAISLAFDTIRSGRADVMLCGGSEAPINQLVVAAFSSMRALSRKNDTPEEACKPFDSGRDGFVIGEGSGMLVLEEWGHALKRNCEIFAEIVGTGSSGDAFHITLPHPDGLGAANAMKAALCDAGINCSEIDSINAHGTGTVANDAVETKAVKSVFGDYAKKIPINSVKSMTGHLLGAAASIEAVSAVQSLISGIVPPTINLKNPDPECDLDYVPNEARRMNLKYLMSNSFGFGGQNSTIIFKKAGR